MEHGHGTAPECCPQRSGTVQRVGMTHQRRNLAEQALRGLGDLLHVVAFPVGGLVPVKVIDTDAIGSAHE